MTLCCLNGEFLEDSKLPIDGSDRGLTLGDGVFDTHHLASKWREEHFERLVRHADSIYITCPWTLDQLMGFSSHIGFAGSIIRTQLTRGPAARGLTMPEPARPTLLMRALPPPPPRPEPVVRISSIRRNDTSPLSRIKSTQYLDAILALKQAQDKGCDDAIFLNSHGHVTCATSANLFVVKDGNWSTPRLEDGVLDGITRAHVIAERGAQERTITIGCLHAADEIWLCNSVHGLLKVKDLKS